MRFRLSYLEFQQDGVSIKTKKQRSKVFPIFFKKSRHSTSTFKLEAHFNSTFIFKLEVDS